MNYITLVNGGLRAGVCEMISSADAAVVVKKRTAWDDSVFTFRPRHNNIVGGSLVRWRFVSYHPVTALHRFSIRPPRRSSMWLLGYLWYNCRASIALHVVMHEACFKCTCVQGNAAVPTIIWWCFNYTTLVLCEVRATAGMPDIIKIKMFLDKWVSVSIFSCVSSLMWTLTTSDSRLCS